MRYFIHLSYDGKNYHGWQIQPGAITVQEVLNKALSTLLRQNIEVTGAGRTDAGVNASLMVAHFDYGAPQDTDCNNLSHSGVNHVEGNSNGTSHSNREKDVITDRGGLLYRLNKLLPQDIAIHKIEQVPDEMHARFSAISRTYHYFVVTEKTPFEPYAYRFPQPLDFDKMNEAAKLLFNYIDFTSFSKLHTDVKTNNCRIMKAEWRQVTPIKWVFEIQADRFLRNMVRAIVGTLLDVGRGAISIQQFAEIIEKKNRCSAGTSVPGNALFLVDIKY
ncbi:MAG: tRNA pseudouridine(38-40) synthase TruA [Prevotellaceae bacterium]|nr:tRNA pseudouridine(38-40) synthase TruA [Candidatus Minthosoma caballi]